MRARPRALAPLLVVAALTVLPPVASEAASPLNDLLALGQGSGQKPQRMPVVRRAEPPFKATPRAGCLPGSRQEPGIQGRVPAGSAKQGFRCNVDLVGHQGSSGGFKVFRYIDRRGNECAFYDTSLLYPTSAIRLDNPSKGISVLDMSNPSRPVETAKLTQLPMLSPHESLNLNPKRGLLAAVLGSPFTYPGLVSIYDVRSDCRHPKLLSTSPVARLGHESGFSPDGRTFYAASTAFDSITAVDVTKPRTPHAIWQGVISSHGMTLAPDGNRAYIADPGGNMLILDTSEIQARKPQPQARELSRLTWRAASIPQNAIPIRVRGKPYVLEFDEYTAGTTAGGNRDDVGAGRIIDISNERKPRVVSNLRLQVNQPADHRAARNDPGAFSPVQGYAAHYCDVPTRVDPKVVACSFINSGLRVFDISDLARPKEIAYYVAPTQSRIENGGMASDFAMSKPAFVPGRREIWYSDGPTGFYVVRVDKRVWPGARSAGPSRGSCLGRRAHISRRGVGRVRLGLTRAQLARRLPPPRRRTKRSWRWCVKGGKGTVAAAFSRRGRVAVVTTTGRRHGNRRVYTGSATRRLRRAYPRRRKLSKRLIRAGRRSRLLFGIRRGKVRYEAVAKGRTIAHRRALRAYLRYAGVGGKRRR